ncbi:NAD-dependent succinate-semialdehyde dehydrogenase [Virgisporangium aurantiacum]|uniref:NAD-dependent succinate-semialdehyde dehydrogenase n=1 Tax=Virgisporangium aurantiacum TaxID=175570 RepID=A0A8J4E6I3_9ACTN|nr:NAD-dependent succinate-semialdehyde dehydrogenase [Virgisporangium aurantiacum]GIJ63193.1 NAD-dependent succinate-semialdehyde dehydrogenase [Virgisporangium aurantiacum]
MTDGYPDDLALFVAGSWVAGGDRATRPVLNPASGAVLAPLPLAGPADLDAAVTGAVATFPAWRATPPLERSAVLRGAAALLRERARAVATAATLEQGKVRAEMDAEVRLAADILDWYAEEGRRAYGRVLGPQAGTRRSVVHEPVGVVAAFAPWNFPVVNPVRKIAPALAAGCTVVVKPAEEAPASALAVARALHDAGLPAGTLSVVFGEPAEVSARWLAEPAVRKVSFTGSVAVGKHLMRLAAVTMKRTTMELGGHAPVIVLPDADIDVAAAYSVGAKFFNAGQACVSPTRFLVHRDVYDRFVDAFVDRARILVLDDGLAEKVDMGPLAHARRPAAMEGFVADAVAAGARALAGGRAVDRPGFFWEPTVLVDVPTSARVRNEEPFGPIAVINRVDDLDAAIAEANRLPFGLAAYAFTDSAAAIRRIAGEVEAGMLGVNTYSIATPDAPFGGVKESGHGSEEGIEGMAGHLVTKAIHEA